MIEIDASAAQNEMPAAIKKSIPRLLTISPAVPALCPSLSLVAAGKRPENATVTALLHAISHFSSSVTTCWSLVVPCQSLGLSGHRRHWRLLL